jgi:hypothetical protein
MNEMRNACKRKPAMGGREYHRLDEGVGGMRDGEGWLPVEANVKFPWS